MKEWMEAKGDPNREKVVMNTRFGESYRAATAFESENFLLKRREAYGAELPEGVLLLTAAVDTQDNRLEYEVCGWGAGEECWGILKGIILSPPNRSRAWQELDAVLDRVYKFEDGSGLKIRRTFIDYGGHFSGAVIRYCEKNYTKGRCAIIGRAGFGIPLYNGKLAKSKYSTWMPIVQLGVDDGKQEVMNRISVSEQGPMYFHFPLDEPGIMSNRGYDERYFKGLISEQRKTVKRNGTYQERWEAASGVRNEPLDLRNYNLACMQSLTPDWDQLYNVIHNEQAATQLEPVKKPRKRTKMSVKTNIW